VLQNILRHACFNRKLRSKRTDSSRVWPEAANAIKGIGKNHVQTLVNAHCSHDIAKLYLSKAPMAAVDVLNDRVLPFYDEHNVMAELYWPLH